MYKLGYKTLKRLCQEQESLGWQNAKLSVELFKGSEEIEVFNWVSKHIDKFHTPPQVETLTAQFPEMKEFEVVEPASYYVDLIERRYENELVGNTITAAKDLLTESKHNTDKVIAMMGECTDKITAQRYRTRILSMVQEAPKLILQTYHNVNAVESTVMYGWPYLDASGGMEPGSLCSIVGRPAMGKTFLVIKSALDNWRRGLSTLLVSMEMAPLAIAQRVTAMYTHTGLTGLKTSTFTDKVYKVFVPKLIGMAKEPADLYVVDGNLAATPDDIYRLAAQLKVKAVYIDGGYLLKNKNLRLDRFTRVSENVERIKHLTSDLAIPTIASFQFSREAAKKAKKDEKIGLEDIGMTDTIGQASSVVLGLMQDESVETMYRRLVDVMKGRNGEVGQFSIHWDFDVMNFDQVQEEDVNDEHESMEWL